MVLAGVLGYAAQWQFGWANATLFGVVLGLVVAQFVPAKTSCSYRAPEPSSTAPVDDAGRT